MRIRVWSRARVLLVVLAVSACTNTAPAPQAQREVLPQPPLHPEAAASAESKEMPVEGAVPLSGTLTCPIPGRNPAGTATSFAVGPRPCDVNTLGEACRILMLTEEHCTWTGITLAGQPLTASVMHGQGYLQGERGLVTAGYDWGSLPNGDWYLGRWTERVDLEAGKIKATWKIVMGTGTLTGILGEAEFSCPPPGPNDLVETCTVTGSYWLPGGK